MELQPELQPGESQTFCTYHPDALEIKDCK